MSPLWTSADIAAATDGDVNGVWEVNGLSIDSRTVKPGDLFIALVGERFDGHAYVTKALEDGAAAVMIAQDVKGLAADAPCIRVADTMEALTALAVAARQRMQGKVAAITGSVGKTSTRAMLMHALSAGGDVHATQGNLNNHIGTPLSLARMPAHVAFAVFELGMNHAGEIAPLTRLVRPDVAIVTTVKAVHLEFFDSVEGIAHAKAEIFEGLSAGGTAIINRDNEYYELLCKAAEPRGRVLCFGAAKDADARLVRHVAEGWGATVDIEVFGEPVTYQLQHPGKFHAFNSLPVLAAAKSMGVPLGAAAKMLQDWQPEPGRGQHMLLSNAHKQITLIDDSYNASPASVQSSLQVLSGLKGRRIAVLGDMLELGDDAPSLHAALADDIAKAEIDAVFTAGPLARHIGKALPASISHHHYDSADALLSHLPEQLHNGDAVLVKGSHGSGMYKVAEGLRDWFNGQDANSPMQLMGGAS